MKNTMGILKGLGTGIAAGMVAGFVGSQMMKNDRQMKQKAERAVNAVGDLFQSMPDMFK